MATTGNLKQIDDALQRPGRMDRVFHLQRPTQAEREKILHIAAKETMDNELIDFVDWRKVISESVPSLLIFALKLLLRFIRFLCGLVTSSAQMREDGCCSCQFSHCIMIILYVL